MYEKFVALLESNGTTAYRVSEETGIPQSTFTDWKNGRSKPKVEKLMRIAKFFDVPLDYFLEEVEA